MISFLIFVFPFTTNPFPCGSAHYAGIQLNPSHTLGTAKTSLSCPVSPKWEFDGLHTLHLPASTWLPRFPYEGQPLTEAP